MNDIFKPKLFTLLKSRIDKKQIISDILAGIVVGIVALPLAIAFAVASGVSPEKGIITAIFSGFIISLLGGSRVQIGGPTGAFIVIVYGIVEVYGVNGLIISTILAGIILIIFGLFRLGSLLKYIPHPLIVGFTSGIALVIFSTQIKDALGLDISDVPSEFMGKWQVYFNYMDTINVYAVIITVTTILLTVFSTKLFKRIPGSFVSIIIMTLVVQLFKLPVFTIESFFGEIPGKFTFIVPEIDITKIPIYLKPALTIALLGAIESLLSAVVADGMIGGNHRSNTELIAQGIANIITPFFGGIPATGAIARTATNIKNGGRTPIAGITHAFTLIIIMLFLGSFAKLIPMPCLAGILIVVSYNMSEWRTFKTILTQFSLDSIVLVSTFLLTVLVDLTIAIEIGVVLSSLLFMKRMAESWKINEHNNHSDIIESYDALPDDIQVYEISGPFFFATAKEYVNIIKRSGISCSRLVIRMRHVPFIDATGLHNLEEVTRLFKRKDTKLYICDINNTVLKSIRKSSIIEQMNIYTTFEDCIDNI